VILIGVCAAATKANVKEATTSDERNSEADMKGRLRKEMGRQAK
jgi:hypothetical protein